MQLQGSDQREEEKQTVIFEFGFHRAHSDPLSTSFGKSSFIHSHPFIHSFIHSSYSSPVSQTFD